MEVAEALKAEGNTFFSDGNFLKAAGSSPTCYSPACLPARLPTQCSCETVLSDCTNSGAFTKALKTAPVESPLHAALLANRCLVPSTTAHDDSMVRSGVQRCSN